jgi:hypothetical protein
MTQHHPNHPVVCKVNGPPKPKKVPGVPRHTWQQKHAWHIHQEQHRMAKRHAQHVAYQRLVHAMWWAKNHPDQPKAANPYTSYGQHNPVSHRLIHAQWWRLNHPDQPKAANPYTSYGQHPCGAKKKGPTGAKKGRPKGHRPPRPGKPPFSTFG